MKTKSGHRALMMTKRQSEVNTEGTDTRVAGTNPSNKYLSQAVYKPMRATLYSDKVFDDFTGLCPEKANASWTNIYMVQHTLQS